MMKKLRIIMVAVLVIAFISESYAQDWPQLLGPDRNGISAQKGLLRTWPQKGPEVLWTANIGIGYGGPVVKSGKVYLLDRDDKTGDMLRCFDFATGKELWSFTYDAPGSVNYRDREVFPPSMATGYTR